LLWQIQHHFPHLEMLANIRRSGRNVTFGPLGFMGWQILGMGPVALPIWICGLWFLLMSSEGQCYRALGWSYLVTVVILLLTAGRFYYLAPAYPMLLAAGALTIEHWLERRQRLRLGWSYLVLVVAGVIGALNTLPLLPPAAYVRYTTALGFSQPQFEHRKASALPQMLADRRGWPEMVIAVADVYNGLPADQRAKTAILASNYGEAGAIDFYGPKLGLPKAISGHVSYWYWGPREYTGESVIVIGQVPHERLEKGFSKVQPAGTVGDPYAMAAEHFTIYLCTGPKGWTLAQVWPRFKSWD
jgi:hypothetical protein